MRLPGILLAGRPQRAWWLKFGDQGSWAFQVGLKGAGDHKRGSRVLRDLPPAQEPHLCLACVRKRIVLGMRATGMTDAHKTVVERELQSKQTKSCHCFALTTVFEAFEVDICSEVMLRPTPFALGLLDTAFGLQAFATGMCQALFLAMMSK